MIWKTCTILWHSALYPFRWNSKWFGVLYLLHCVYSDGIQSFGVFFLLQCVNLAGIQSHLVSCTVCIVSSGFKCISKVVWCLCIVPIQVEFKVFGDHFFLHCVHLGGIQSFGVLCLLHCVNSGLIQSCFFLVLRLLHCVHSGGIQSRLMSSAFYIVFIQVEFKVIWCPLPSALCSFRWNSVVWCPLPSTLCLFRWNSKLFGVLY